MGSLEIGVKAIIESYVFNILIATVSKLQLTSFFTFSELRSDGYEFYMPGRLWLIALDLLIVILVVSLVLFRSLFLDFLWIRGTILESIDIFNLFLNIYYID